MSTHDAHDVPVDAFAYYLPQFYPMELNDRWWGEGFTEWVSVLRAHAGHRSPRGTLLTPGELGFYDLRSAETRARQGELARGAGLAAFCYYHYWSAGDRLMPEVEDRILADGEPDVPYFLAWANHDWTLAWQGRANEVIHRQAYDEHLNDNHIHWLCDAMDDPRYYRLDGRAVVLVYDPRHLPEHRRVFDRWRSVASRRGHDLHLLGAASSPDVSAAATHGLDAWVQGTSYVLGGMDRWQRARRSARRPGTAWRHLRHADIFWEYDDLASAFAGSHDLFPSPTVPLVLSSWNNLGRRSRKGSSTNATPDAFGRAMRRAIGQAPVHGRGHGARRLVAINAWNEWGEGMTLEPSIEYGRAFLERLGEILRS